MPSTHCLGACILCKRHWLYLVSGASRTSAEAACMAYTQGNTQHDVHVNLVPRLPRGLLPFISGGRRVPGDGLHSTVTVHSGYESTTKKQRYLVQQRNASSMRQSIPEFLLTFRVLLCVTFLTLHHNIYIYIYIPYLYITS